ncbi:MAG: outer membrane protein assembly factor BamD [bacterium]|nr:outer membrane protein assembly factor BamD [bacterium]
MRRTLPVVLVVSVLLALAGCAGKKPITPAADLWTQGSEAMDQESWDLAIEKYKALLDQYPFDPNAEQAELRIAQAYYFSNRYPEAIAAFGDFERMHPTSPNLAEIEYRRGLAYLAQHKTPDRDQQAVTNALGSFQNIVDRYPGTPWADRATLRIRECRESLAEHDAGIATFYLRRGSLRAAEARLRGLLRQYPDTDATAQTLWVFAAAWRDRDEPEEAHLALATLAYHRPELPIAAEARDKLATTGGVPAQDPMPALVARIDALAYTPERLAVPSTVSSYPERAGAGQPGAGR